MRRIRVLAPVVGLSALGLLMVVLPAFRPDAQDRAAHAPDGYIEIVRDVFGRFEWLRIEEPINPTRLDDENGCPIGGRAVVLTQEACDRPEVVDFYLNSFLRDDINANDPLRWDIDGLRVKGLQNGVRSSYFPGDAPSAWRGTITFRPGEVGLMQLAGPGHIITLRPGPIADDLAAVHEIEAPSGYSEAASIRLVRKGRAVARLLLLGDTPVIRVNGAPSDSGVRMWVNDAEIRGQADAVSYAIVPPGGEVRLADNVSGVSLLRLERTGAQPEVSRPDAFGRRRLHPSTEQLARPIEIAADRDDRGDVPITLDRDLHVALQQMLEVYCETGRPLGKNPGAAFRAAIAVMDVRNGELLALASYPNKPDHLPSDGSGKALTTFNNNFLTLEAGSTAKIPVAAAVLNARPVLGTLEVQGQSGAFSTLLGVGLDEPVGNRAGAAWIDFDEFVRTSSNKYAAALLLLGLSSAPEQPDPAGIASEAYRLGGAERRRLPRIAAGQGRGKNGGVRLEPLASVHTRPWAGQMESLFGVSVESIAGASDADGSHEVSVWEGGPTWSADARKDLTAVSPQRVRLGLNGEMEFRRDYISLVLGGARSRWTTIKLAESYGRIVTGRTVKARLLRSRTSTLQARLHSLEPEVQQRLRRALLTVGQPRGTAYSTRLTGALETLEAQVGGPVRLFSKTGTSELEQFAPTAMTRALDRLIQQRALQILPSGEVRVRDRGNTLRPEDAGAVIGRVLTAATTDGSTLAPPQRVAERLRRYNADPKTRGQILEVRDGAVTGAVRPRLLNAERDGSLYVFVLETDDPRRRNVAVAINIQKTWTKKTWDTEADLGHTAARLGTEVVAVHGERLLTASRE